MDPCRPVTEYFINIFSTREYLNGIVTLNWDSPDGRHPLSFKDPTFGISSIVRGQRSQKSRLLYSTSRCETTFRPNSAISLKQSCLKVGFKLEKIPTLFPQGPLYFLFFMLGFLSCVMIFLIIICIYHFKWYVLRLITPVQKY